jgi:integrase
MARKTRLTVEPNIYQDDYGFEIIIRKRRKTGRARYLGHHHTIDFLREERDRITTDLESSASILKGTFAGDVAALLKTLPEGNYTRNRVRQFRAWTDAGFGRRTRREITTAMINAQCGVWRAAGIAPSTINHRIDALRALYRFHDKGLGPCDGVKRQKERRDVRVVPQALVEAVLMQLECVVISKKKQSGLLHPTAARLMVLARTGLPPEQIRRLRPTDIDLENRTMFVRSRKKGAGVPGRTLPITHAAVVAFQAMHVTKAWGSFSTSSMRHHFNRAVTKARAKWCKHCGPWPAPAHFRPYDLRHGFLTEVYRRTRDLRVTAEFGLHADMSMTAMYAQAAVTETATAARDLLDGTARKSQ